MGDAGVKPATPTTSTANRTTPEELGREALSWFLDGLGKYVPARYLPERQT